MKHSIGYVIDLETAATTVDAVILSIGVVEIDFRELRLTGREGYWPVAAASQPLRRCCANTMKWWQQRTTEAWTAAFGDPSTQELGAALAELAVFIAPDFADLLSGDYSVWGNGPEFDIAILNHAFMQYALAAPQAGGDVRRVRTMISSPWAYNDARCVRTLRDVAGLPKGPFLPGEIEHHALHDARREARDVVAALKFLLQRIVA